MIPLHPPVRTTDPIMFVDDLKVYAEGKMELEDTIKVVEGVSGRWGSGSAR